MLIPVLVGLLLALGGAGAVLATVLTSGDDTAARPTAKPKREVVTVTKTVTGAGEVTTVQVTTKVPASSSSTPTATSSTSTPSGAKKSSLTIDQAVSLTDQATYRMRAGSFDEALALALQAYSRLKGTGQIYEAYAAYDAGRSYAELGNCDKALPLLDHAESIEGRKSAIDQARALCK
jgi:hypothetical protein